MSNRLMTYFQFDHLPAGPIQYASRECAKLAEHFDTILEESAEKTAGLRKLLEAKDCFVRASLDEVKASKANAD